MTLISMVATTLNRNGQIFLAGAIAVAAALSLAPVSAQAAGGGSYKPSDAVSFEEIPGSTVKRVILTERAAERLGIELGEVSKETIILKQMVGGLITPPVKDSPEPKIAESMFSGFGQAIEVATDQSATDSTEVPASDESWVRVTLSQGEWERMRKDQPARIVPLATRDDLASDVLAMPSDLQPVQDVKRSMLKLYYIILGGDHGLNYYDRVRVELQLTGSGKQRMVVPYSAVYYDGTGAPWVYVNPEPLVFQRQRIEVERIVGNLAVITDGPPIGTKVVTIGAPLLYGAEVIYKR
jgi:hypothetical protein